MREKLSHDEAGEEVERLVDSGIMNVAEAWYTVDPDRSIRNAQEQSENRDQQAVNAPGAEATRDIGRAATIAKINMIQNPDERKRALNEFNAHERVKELRRGQRA